jgi:hypothetical protein
VLENGFDHPAAGQGFTGSVCQDLDANDDGVLDATPWVSIADGVAVSDGGAGDRAYTSVVLTPGFDGDAATPRRVVARAQRHRHRYGRRLAAQRFRRRRPARIHRVRPLRRGDQHAGRRQRAVLPTSHAIYEIQGAGHVSAFAGQAVTTTGVVTAIDTNGARGFFIQDAAGDGDSATSDGIFVFTNALPTVAVGQLVQVSGTVSEFFPGGPRAAGSRSPSS